MMSMNPGSWCHRISPARNELRGVGSLPLEWNVHPISCSIHDAGGFDLFLHIWYEFNIEQP